ncbi:unnamed protein product [Timema podura]|uniref:Uncharacterized protein n=1 Tax=Timema podura TaxID=61482 RepID=A0ABN7NMF7_TIMPD|nr:unnamed protein product [Timema podura]
MECSKKKKLLTGLPKARPKREASQVQAQQDTALCIHSVIPLWKFHSQSFTTLQPVYLFGMDCCKVGVGMDENNEHQQAMKKRRQGNKSPSPIEKEDKITAVNHLASPDEQLSDDETNQGFGN